MKYKTLIVYVFTIFALAGGTNKMQAQNDSQITLMGQVNKEIFGEYMHRPFYRIAGSSNSFTRLRFGRNEVYYLPADYDTDILQFEDTKFYYRGQTVPITEIKKEGKNSYYIRGKNKSGNYSIFMTIADADKNKWVVTATTPKHTLGESFRIIDSKGIKINTTDFTTSYPNIKIVSPIMSQSLADVKRKYSKSTTQLLNATRIDNVEAYLQNRFGKTNSILFESDKLDIDDDGIEDTVLLVRKNMQERLDNMGVATLLAIKGNKTTGGYLVAEMEIPIKTDKQNMLLSMTVNGRNKSISLSVTNKLKHEIRTYTWIWSGDDNDWMPSNIATNIPEYQDVLREGKRMKPLKQMAKLEPFKYYFNLQLDDNIYE